jgi:hypothetical protein
MEDLDFKSWLLRKTDVTAPSRELVYSSCFSDRLIQTSLQPLAAKYRSAKSEDERIKALLEGQSAMVMYSTLIYYVLPSAPALKRQINSNPEMKKNFLKLKGWFDENGGPKIAGDYYQELVKGIGSHEPW